MNLLDPSGLTPYEQMAALSGAWIAGGIVLATYSLFGGLRLRRVKKKKRKKKAAKKGRR